MIRPRKRQAFSILLLFVALLLLRYAVVAITPFMLVQLYHFRWKHHHTLYSLGLAGFLTKPPLVQIVNENTVDLVFETRHRPPSGVLDPSMPPSATVSWSIEGGTRQITQATSTHDEMEIFVFRARISSPSIASSAFLYHIEIGSWTSDPAVLNLLALSKDKGTLRIGVLGDNQFAAVRFSKVLSRMTRKQAKFDLMIHLGDAVQDAASARAWTTDFWSPIGQCNLLELPWILLRGNHDAPSEYTSAPFGRGKVGYSSIYLSRISTFILILDSNTDTELQDRFLNAELRSDRAQAAARRIVLVHIPPFIEYWAPRAWQSGEKLWGQFVRTKWVPIFQAQHVDLVISGHQHNYQRGQMNGVTYLIAGGAGGTLDHERVEDYQLQNPLTVVHHHFGVLELDEQAGIHWKLYLDDGTLADDIVI